MKVTIHMTHDSWETIGTATLEGMLLDAAPDTALNEARELDIVIDQTTFGWRSQNGGPHEFITNENVPLCLLESILNLITKGYRISLIINEVGQPSKR